MRAMLRATVFVALAAAACNALLGIDDGTYEPRPDAAAEASSGSDATPDADAGVLLSVSTKRSEIRLPRGRTTTIAFAIANRATGGPPISVRVSDLPTGVTLASSVVLPDNGSASFTLTAADDAPAVTASPSFVFTEGTRTATTKVQLRIAPPGTLDVLYNKTGVVDVVRTGFEALLPDLLAVRGTTVTAVVNPGEGRPVVSVFRYVDDGTPDPRFGDAGLVELPPRDDKCRTRGARLVAEGLLVLETCPTGASVYSVDDTGKVTTLLSDASLPGTPIGFGRTKGGVPTLVLHDTDAGAAAIEVRTLDASASTRVNAVPMAFPSIVESAGRLTIAGQAIDASAAAVVALKSDDQLDPTFGDGGILPLPQLDAPIEVVISTRGDDGGVLVLGLPPYPGVGDTRFANVHGDGVVDTSFPLASFVKTIDGRGTIVARDDRDRIVLGSNLSSGVPRFERFSKEGVRDTGFGDGGLLALNLDCVPNTIEIDEDGMLVVLCLTQGTALFRIWP